MIIKEPSIGSWGWCTVVVQRPRICHFSSYPLSISRGLFCSLLRSPPLLYSLFLGFSLLFDWRNVLRPLSLFSFLILFPDRRVFSAEALVVLPLACVDSWNHVALSTLCSPAIILYYVALSTLSSPAIILYYVWIMSASSLLLSMLSSVLSFCIFLRMINLLVLISW